MFNISQCSRPERDIKILKTEGNTGPGVEYSAVTGLNDQFDAARDEDEESASDSDSCDDDNIEDTRGVKVGVGARRPKHETKEEKADRKKAIKDAKAEKRKEKIPKHVKKRKEKSKK